MKHTLMLVLAVAAFAPTFSHAAIIPFDLQGSAGFGLLPGNENTVLSGTPGTGGEIGAGITFDDVTKVLTVNIGWGSGNGFTDLTSTAIGAHIHGPTTGSGTASFTQSAGVLINLASGGFTFNTSATSGSVVGVSSALSPTNEADLFSGKFYINIHTSTNGGGEIRGNLVAVPEPASIAALAGLSVLGCAAMRRRRLA